MCIHSSVVSNVVPRLPGILDLTVSLFYFIIFFLGFQNGPDHVDAFEVSISVFSRLTDVYRFRFKSSASAPGSNDPT